MERNEQCAGHRTLIPRGLRYGMSVQMWCDDVPESHPGRLHSVQAE